MLRVGGLLPSRSQQSGFLLAPEQIFRRIFDDAVDVDFDRWWIRTTASIQQLAPGLLALFPSIHIFKLCE